jgi:DNA-binding response OmpR family regulator
MNTPDKSPPGSARGGAAVPLVAVVDDEAATRDMVGDYLRLHGFSVVLCDGGRALREQLARQSPDLIVLDLNMPEEDGLSIVRDLKARSAIPIIMLTATASAIDRVVGLELGADDYLPKPCELRELVARVRSVLRRVQAPAPGAAAPAAAPSASEPRDDGRRIRFGTKWLELDALRLSDDTGLAQALTRSEFDLLKAFADHPKRALSRERLLDLADARDPDAFDRAIDVRINRIRKKIEPDPGNPRYIRTVRGLGYVFRPEGD